MNSVLRIIAGDERNDPNTLFELPESE